MNALLLAQNGIARIIRAAGNAIVDVRVAEAQAVTPTAGEDYLPTFLFHDGKGVWEKANGEDYPGTSIMIDDRTLLLMQCAHETKVHEALRVGNLTFLIEAQKIDRVGDVAVLQKLLVRPKPVDIEWDSADQLVA